MIAVDFAVDTSGGGGGGGTGTGSAITAGVYRAGASNAFIQFGQVTSVPLKSSATGTGFMHFGHISLITHVPH